MQLTVVLRKEVADVAEAETLTDIVKQKLTELPSITITSQVTEKIDNS